MFICPLSMNSEGVCSLFPTLIPFPWALSSNQSYVHSHTRNKQKTLPFEKFQWRCELHFRTSSNIVGEKNKIKWNFKEVCSGAPRTPLWCFFFRLIRIIHTEWCLRCLLYWVFGYSITSHHLLVYGYYIFIYFLWKNAYERNGFLKKIISR